ncbi:MAG: hypothetical protein PHT40_00035 [Patescibacteria group bacterium]|nr:hypothetical protein [Patescibacteria group bacterium]
MEPMTKNTHVCNTCKKSFSVNTGVTGVVNCSYCGSADVRPLMTVEDEPSLPDDS